MAQVNNTVVELYVKSLRWVGRHMVVALIILFGAGLLNSMPNRFTHHCVPTLRTSAGYPANLQPSDAFCPAGYQAELKWGQNRIKGAMIEIAFIVVPLGLIVPAAFLIYIEEVKSRGEKQNWHS